MDDRQVEVIAAAAHQANRAYCIALGDESQPNWFRAPEWQKASARAGVRAALANALMTPRESHESWLAQKLAEGWRYGPVKSVEAKEHPCCVLYDELPEAQRRKDEIFLTTVREMAGAMDPNGDGR